MYERGGGGICGGICGGGALISVYHTKMLMIQRMN